VAIRRTQVQKKQVQKIDVMTKHGLNVLILRVRNVVYRARQAIENFGRVGLTRSVTMLPLMPVWMNTNDGGRYGDGDPGFCD